MKCIRTLFVRLFVAPAMALFLVANTIGDRAEALMEEGKEAEAFELVRQGAAEGDADAINYLAWFYDNGRYVETDRARAAELYRQAADEGVAFAQWRLGVMIDTGEAPGTPEEAFALFEKSAAQDFTNAMTSLAVMHATGRGTKRDPMAARYYYSMAAAAGNPHGVRGLGILYLHGEGVDRDPIEASAYFLIAASLGNEQGKESFDVVTEDYDDATMKQVAERATELAGELGYRFEQEPAAE